MTKQVELVRKKEFITTIFDLDNEIFVVYIVFPASLNLII